MKIYAVLSLKGGVGKSTSAMHLAAVAATTQAVVVLDTDEERSSSRWADRCAAEGQDLGFRVVPGERDRLAQQARELSKNAVVIIDTPPNNREVLSRAGMVANTCIIPVVPTGLDIDRMVPTLEMLRDVEAAKGSIDVVILLTRWNSRERLARETLEALGRFPLLETKIRSLVGYKEAFGGRPNYLEEYAGVWKELQQ